MSKSTHQNLECPHCGNSQETMVWHTINVTLNPELKKSLFEAQINLFSYEKCGHKTFINSPLLYRDMTLQLLVQYYPLQSLNDMAFFRQFNPDGSLAMTRITETFAKSGMDMTELFAKSGAYLTTPHIVFDINEMLRYVLFRDRIAEMKKNERTRRWSLMVTRYAAH